MNKNIRKIIVYYTDGTYSEIQSAAVSEIKPVINPSITKCQVCGFPGGHGGLACPTLTGNSIGVASNTATPTAEELTKSYKFTSK
jgi:hypothetical protein